MKVKITVLLLVGFAACTAAAGGQDFSLDGTKRNIILPEVPTVLTEGPGADVTRRYCAVCHSLDYIVIQPKFGKAKWRAEVEKMIKTYGAPIPEADAALIADYIAVQYGTGGS